MKNNLTLLAREGKAKSLQNTGGASQQSTAQHDSARVFKYFNTQMARFLWSKKGEATVSKSSCSWAQGRSTSAEQPTNHALITHLSPTQTVSLARIWKYVACLLLAFVLGVGNVWGTSPFEIEDPTANTTNKDGITVFGIATTAKFATVTSTKVYDAKNASLNIYSECVNITGISFDAQSSSSGSSADTKNLTIKVSASGTNALAVPSSGFTATKDGNSLASLTDIGLNKDGQAKNTISITFNSPVKVIELCKGSGSNGSRIRNITITYSTPSSLTEYYKATLTAYNAATINPNPGGASITLGTKNSSKTISPKTYYQLDGTTIVDLGDGNAFQVGDQIIAEVTKKGIVINGCSCAIAITDAIPSIVGYVVAASDGVATQQTCSIARISSDSYLHSVRVVRASGGGGDTPTTYTVTYNGNGNTSGDVPTDSDSPYEEGDEVTVLGNTGSLARTGYTFSGWNTEADGTGDSYAASETFDMGTANVTLYAKWTLNLSTHSAGTYETAAGSGGYGLTLKTYSGRDYEIYTFNTSKLYAGSSVTSSDGKEMLTAVANTDVLTSDEWLIVRPSDVNNGGDYNSPNEFTFSSATDNDRKTQYVSIINTDYIALKVSGYDQFSFFGRDNGTGDGKKFVVKIDGESQTYTHSGTDNTVFRFDISTETHVIEITAEGTSACRFRGFSLRLPEVSCDATVPGNISKGDLTAGSITLTAAGLAETGDTWYWQNAENGEEKGTYGSGATKNVSAPATWYIRSYNESGNCWSAAKSIELTAEDFLATPEVTFNNGAYVVGASALNLSSLFTSQNTSAVTFALKVASEDATVSGSNFTATKEGSYVIVATQAADASYKAVSEEATIVVTYPATGEATILYNVAIGTENTALGTASTEDNSASISNLSNFTAAGGLTVSGRGAGKDGLSTKLETLESQDYKKYIYVTFDVADGKEFVLDSISTKIVAVTTAKTIKIVVSDTEGAKDSLDYSQAKNSTAAHHQFNFTSSAKAYAGTVTVKIYAYGATDDYRLGQPLKVCGVVRAGVVKYNVTFAAGEGSGSMSTLKYAASTEVTLPACTFTAPDEDHEFDAWVVTKTVGGASVTVTNGKFTMPAEAVTATATWKEKEVRYAITEGTPANGTVDADLAEAPAGETVTITATPATDYLFSAWDVYKTSESSVKVAVTETAGVYTFEMPAYAVTVSASFVADTRKKILYVTSNSESDTKSSDKLYAALKDDYRVAIVGPASDADQTGYDLVVLHESVGGSSYNATAVAAAKTGTTPVLNTKAYFYNSGRWAWGTPNAGRKTKGVHVNRTYCNITNHPLFNDLTPDANDSIIILSSINGDNKPIQPIGSFTSGKEGYTLANVPDGCAIHELTPAQRGAVSGKYLLISLYTKDFANLNANGQKLFQNAAAYLIGNTAWEPVNALSSPAVTASPSAAYSVGDNIALTASATGSSAATTYTWYKGDTWAAAEEAGAIQAAATAAADGNIYGITGCALGDAGTYWCVISNGTGCEVSASLAITVSDIAYNISFSSAHGTAPSATTGVSYTLPELSADGWSHQGWTADINVTVDAATVTAGTTIDNGKIATFGADVEFTAVWAEVFDVTFNMQSHGASIAAQHIVDGGKATEPNDPSAIGWDFGGWFTDAECTEGNEFDFNTAISDDTELFAKWTAFTGCTELWPATSGDAPAAVGDAIVMQTGSKGAAMTVVAKPDKLAYTSSGLQFGSESGVKVNVVLNNDMTVGTKISLTLVANGGKTRGLNLYTKTGTKIDAFTCWVDGTNPASDGAEDTFTYTVVAEDGLDGTNEFQLWRNNTVCLKCVKVESCGDAIIYHDLTSAISPDHDPAYATVTLGASSVREGRTTTAEYSAINAAYEFDEWQISGTGATLSSTTANPVTITMGTADAVVTLKLKAATPKHTVTFNKMGKGDDIDDQEVKEGDLVEEPTVTEPEGWILEGWYTENTFETKWDFANDVMSTSDIELFANWVADTSIKLLSGSTVNHTDFITGVSAETVEISSVDYNCVKFSGTVSNVNGVKDLTRVIAYNAKTNKTKIQLHLYNTSTSSRTVLVKGVLEGNTSADDIVDLASITLGNKEQKETEYIEFNNAANRTIYIFIGSSAGDVRFLQVKVIDDGATPMKAAGQAGYSLNLNKGRFFGPASTDLAFEGLNVRLSGEYTAMNSGYAKLASTSMSFTVASAMTLNVTANNNKTYYVTKGSAGTDNETAKAGVSEFDLTAGTWYITAGSNEVQFTNIAFIAPKCAEPAFNALANSELCEGDAFVALDGTATVADAGTPIYQWYNADGDAAIDGETDATYTPTADGSYYVIATNQLSGYSDNTKKSATVTVTHYASAAITTAPEDVRKDVGEEATLSVVATGKNLSYEWFTCDDAEGTNPVAIVPAETGASLTVTVPEGEQYYMVVVSSDCGEPVSAVAKAAEWREVPQANVTESITWDWTSSAWPAGKNISFSPADGDLMLLANVSSLVPANSGFRADMLLGSGQYIWRDGGADKKCFQGNTLKFHTAVAGAVTVYYRSTSSGTDITLNINGVAAGHHSTTTYTASETVLVPANSDVEITKTGTTYARINKIVFQTLDELTPDYTRSVTQGYYGTICLPNGGIMVGATLFELTYFDSSKKKIFCDEIVSGEMVAGTPYIFLPLEGASQLGVYYTDAAGADAGNAHGLFGSYDQELITPNDGNYILYNNQYCFVNSTAYVGANRAYIKLYGDGAATRVENPAAAPKPKQGRRRVAMSAYGEQVATGMDGVQGEGVPYQKVMIDGQLYIMRDGRIYNATGIMVK